MLDPYPIPRPQWPRYKMVRCNREEEEKRALLSFICPKNKNGNRLKIEEMITNGSVSESSTFRREKDNNYDNNDIV